MKAVHFGAGNIGRGFLGQLYFESGYETVFVDVVPQVVEGLQTRREYPLRIVGDEPVDLRIGRVTAVNGQDLERVAAELAEADIASTAVGVNVLAKVIPTIAQGIAKRFTGNPEAKPLNIIVCENLLDAGSFMREEVRKRLDSALHAALDGKVGFVEASIGRMVPTMTDAMRQEDPLLVCVEAYCELPVDAQGFRGGIPEIVHMAPRANFKAYVERKLFVHNAGHAVTAYLGYLRGHDYIWQAMEDERIREVADAAMAETRAGLVKKHGLDANGLVEHWDDLKRRFRNKALGDQVVRVAADPVRKLGPKDRLIGSALMCLSQGVEPVHMAFAAAAAIRYDYPADAAAQRIQETLKTDGLQGVLMQYCQLAEDSPLAGLIGRGLNRLQSEGWTR